MVTSISNIAPDHPSLLLAINAADTTACALLTGLGGAGKF